MLDATPYELVSAIHRGDADARTCVERWCRTYVVCLIDRVVGRYGYENSSQDRKALVNYVLRWLIMYIRSRPSSDFANMSRSDLVMLLYVAAFKMLHRPSCPLKRGEPNHAEDERRSGSLLYRIWTYSQPCEQVGGDWLGVDIDQQQRLWVMVCDVTGHGLAAYILASGLPYLWHTTRIVERRSQAATPTELLGLLGQELEPILPEGVFVEAALSRFGANGEVAVAAAGLCRVILRRSGQAEFDLQEFGGFLLGLECADSSARDHREWTLTAEDEILFASDGLFEQPDVDNQELRKSLAPRANKHLSTGKTLHDAIVDTLSEVLGACRQRDDITVVTVGIRQETPAVEDVGQIG
jgi:hypothetical protein